VIAGGVYTVKGSANWSLPGGQRQDNELSLGRDAVIAAETRAILDLNYDFMLKQMVGTKLDVSTLLAPKTRPRCRRCRPRPRPEAAEGHRICRISWPGPVSGVDSLRLEREA